MYLQCFLLYKRASFLYDFGQGKTNSEFYTRTNATAIGIGFTPGVQFHFARTLTLDLYAGFGYMKAYGDYKLLDISSIPRVNYWGTGYMIHSGIAIGVPIK